MYPMPTPQMPPIAPGTSMLTRGMFQGGAANQLSSLPLQQGVMGQSGGILSKLLGGAQAGGGGFTNILGMLQNAQKAIGVFQQVSPMVQQYAPFVKSLPALISMMRNSGSSESGDDETASVEETSVKQQVKKSKSKKKSQKNPTTKTKDKKSPSTRKKITTLPSKKSSSMEIARGLPAPKLYI
ncbi:MAG: VrrA/YqfQ family protein [Anaerobacillus sp.]|uniref:VrrA/YqfQ family protein n=1 Tax=Anaerobacillus sp. TaxID=1872506 RepID=UPI00391D8BB1